MALIDGSSLPFGFTVGVRTNAPRVRIEDARLGRRRIFVRGSTTINGQTYRADVYYYGRFQYSRDSVTGTLNRWTMFPDVGGAFRVSDINLDVKDLVKKTPWELERQILRGGDKIIGSNLDDILRGREGDDVLIGRGGRNRLTGGAGKDTFVISNKGLQIITDFNVKEDRILLPGPVSGYDRYEWFRQGGKSLVSRDDRVLAEFLGAPNLNNATFV
jgi:Ca2+-binding RTX toxin-like protein